MEPTAEDEETAAAEREQLLAQLDVDAQADADEKQRARDKSSQKRFVAWEDLRDVLEEEDKIDFAFREIRFHVFFFVFVVPFFIMQSHISARFQTLEQLRGLLERREFYTGFPTNFTSQQPPPFWFPSDPVAADGLNKLNFAQVSAENEYWDWVTQVIGQGIMFPRFQQMGIGASEEEAFWYLNNSTLETQIENAYIFRQARTRTPSMVLLEGARFRSIRVVAAEPRAKSAANKFQDLQLYPPFDSSVEATSLERYGLFSCKLNESSSGNVPQNFYPAFTTFVFSWEQSEVLQTRDVRGNFASYPGNGFTATLPLQNSSWYSTMNRIAMFRNGIANLTRDGWDVGASSTSRRSQGEFARTFFTPATRAVILSMTFYNGNTNLYAFVECVLEISAAGTFNTFVNYYISPQPGRGSSSVPLDSNALAEVIFAWIAVGYMVLCFLRLFRNLNSYRYGSPWVLVELTTLALYGVSIAWIARAYALTQGNPLSLPDADIYTSQVTDPFWICKGEATTFAPCGGQPPLSENFGLWAKDFISMQFVFALLFLSGCLKLMRFMLQFWRFRVFTKTLKKAGWDLLFFLIIFTIMFVGYTLSGYLFYQANSTHFRSLSRSAMYTLLNFIRVDTAYYALVNVNVYASVFTPVYFFSYFFVFVWTFASVLLAIIYNAWYWAKGATYEQASKGWKERMLRQDLLALFSVGDTLERNPYAMHSQTSLRVALRYLCHRNAERRRLGRERICVFACARPRRGWIDKETAMLRLKLWKERRENANVYFLDAEMLQAALGRKVNRDQVTYYFTLLEDNMYTKIEVDQRETHLALQRERDGQGSLQGSKVSLLTRNSITTSIDNLSSNHDAWLMQVDSYLALMRGSHAQNLRTTRTLAEDAHTLAVYSRGPREAET
ncbi:Hypothetical Protein FCC1311_081012 [Hondaea fermentalgiana]|uniref:Polycystin cation channel PKD1/PKD2 domain-containing protein n=1 Tax=Hondaea fermentalgiana TaxID=2315210 RepID=A0A2R5GLV4_9STRA|nr:Hypothetical Protein FCC1311_081012 [Hondaea fermentalgiana]|eukprot:GBG31876.1 Hypothetical Protein FCC1311_081012 [Hondaea fermentalgiana]